MKQQNSKLDFYQTENLRTHQGFLFPPLVADKDHRYNNYCVNYATFRVPVEH